MFDLLRSFSHISSFGEEVQHFYVLIPPVSSSERVFCVKIGETRCRTCCFVDRLIFCQNLLYTLFLVVQHNKQ